MSQRKDPICEDLVDLLPAFLTGTLEDARRADMRGHLEICLACREVAKQVRWMLEVASTHIPSWEQSAYALGGPTKIPTELIEAHLYHCAACRDEHQLLRAVRDSSTDSAMSVVYRKTRLWLAASVTAVAFAAWIFLWVTPQGESTTPAAARVDIVVENSESGQSTDSAILFSADFESGNMIGLQVVQDG